MEFVIGLAQCAHHQGEEVLKNVERFFEEARDAGVDLLVFPEGLMTRFEGSVEDFCAQAQPADGPFAQAVDALAAQSQMWVAYTVNEFNPAGMPYNAAIVTDARGVRQRHYRKVHLFDAQGKCESARNSAGDVLMEPVRMPFATIGLGICYDVRFPEVALSAALAGAQVMLYPAAWVAGEGKVRQWETLLAARAIENGMFVAGVGSCDADTIGHSCVFAPDGAKVASCDEREQLLTCVIDTALVAHVRARTPSLDHRRPDCYERPVSNQQAADYAKVMRGQG